jgi:hypothetical protein
MRVRLLRSVCFCCRLAPAKRQLHDPLLLDDTAKASTNDNDSDIDVNPIFKEAPASGRSVTGPAPLQRYEAMVSALDTQVQQRFAALAQAQTEEDKALFRQELKDLQEQKTLAMKMLMTAMEQRKDAA